VFASFLASLLAGTVEAQVAWSVRESMPPNAGAPGLAYDEARQRLVVFGGLDHFSRVWFDQTWERTGGNWERRVTPFPPAARSGTALAYDSGRRRVVMFGGSGAGWSVQSDTWEWDGNNWVQRFPFTIPPARSFARMEYHAATGRVIMFGGRDVHDEPLGDTWAYDGTTWVRMNATPAPQARYYHHTSYDSVRGRTVLFGGQGPAVASETWEWDGSAWQLRNPAHRPPLRRLGGMTFDAARGVTVLFGGSALGDTWEWDGNDWAQRTPAASPSPREQVAMVYDSARQRCVLYGGGERLHNDLWEWDGTTWFEASAGTPALRQRAAMAFDARRSRVVMFGGDVYDSGGTSETWEWSAGSWERVAVAGAGPSARSGAALAFSSREAGVLLFGGDVAGQPLVDTWLWNGSQWRQLAAGPGARAQHAMCDSAAGALMFGGHIGNVDLGDTWVHAISTWRLLQPRVSPPARRGHVLAFDSRRGRVVMFGGHSATVAGFVDTWEFDGQEWHDRQPVHAPPARDGHQMVYDVARERVVLFGGIVGQTPVDDVWEWDGTDWTQRSVPSAPAPRQGHAMAYDGAAQEVVLFAGKTGWGLRGWSDTWTYEATRPASHTSYAPACRSGVWLTFGSLPWVGGAVSVSLGAPGVLTLGASRTRIGALALPLDLTPFGMTGCQLATSADVLVPSVSGSVSFPVPPVPALVGSSLFAQAVLRAPQANPAGLLTSDAWALVLGLR